VLSHLVHISANLHPACQTAKLPPDLHAELPTVVRNDEVDWPSLSQRIAAGEFHNIVISPGPGTPQRPGDVGALGPRVCAWDMACTPVVVMGNG